MYSSLSRKAFQLHEKLTSRRILERLEELNRTQWLSQDELLRLQREKLQRLVEYAYEFVPYYRRTFDHEGFRPQDLRNDPACLTKLPILTKSIIRENFNDLQTTEPERRRRMSKLSTSGSTGQPLVFMQDSDFRDFVTADIQRHMGWAGCKLGDRQAFIWGASHRMSLWRKMRSRLLDGVWNRFVMDAFMMTDETMTTFAKRVYRKRPQILFGYATALYRFAQFIKTSKFQEITFDGLFSTSETLLPPVRLFLEETFLCKVFNRYGTLELGGVACECEAHSGLHISMENNYVEILRDGLPSKPRELGDITVTNLNNLGMPFIRYSVGDVGSWFGDDKCSCRRDSLRLNSLDGRIVDSFLTRDGHTVWSGFAGAAFRCLTHPAISQFQIVQKTVDTMIVRLVKEGELPQSTLNEIRYAIQSTYGINVEVNFEFLDKIQPLPSGKHQYAISEINNR
jgi:phenylacetate-CoA ligase